MDDPPGNTDLINILSGQNLIYFLSFVFIAVLLLLSALISAAEVAFFSLKPDELGRCKQSVDKREKRITTLLKKPRELLGTILVVNNLSNVGVITISTFLMWEMTGTRTPAQFIIGIVIFSVTFIITFFGEIIPKVYATKKNLILAKRVVNVVSILMVIFKPITRLLLNMSNFVDSKFKRKAYETTVEDLNQALDIATVNDETTKDEKEFLKGIVNFGTLTVKQVMRSRMDISAANIEMNFIELIDWVNKSGFSRIPVYRETADKIEGVLYIKDLLPFMDQDVSFDWHKLLRPGFFVPETKKIDSLLKDFQEKRVHMALVVDEYGGTSGLITLEDIIEEIIGDINDEFDEVKVNFQKIDDNTFVFEGKTSLNDFCKVLDCETSLFDPIRKESESLSGMLLELNNEFPKLGDQLSYEQFTFIIEDVDSKTIKQIKVQVHEQKEN